VTTVTQAKPAPVRVKLYGFYSTTKRRYLTQVVIAAVLVALLLAGWLYYRVSLRERLRGINAPAADQIVAVWDLAPWVVLVVAVLQVIEAYFVLRAFARKQAEAATASPPAPQPPPQA
jgi:hypothetical protein